MIASRDSDAPPLDVAALAEAQSTRSLPAGVTVDRLGLLFAEAIPFREWVGVGVQLGLLPDASPWWLGDWMVEGESRYGIAAAEMVGSARRARATVLEYARTARKVPRSRRHPALAFTHHQLIAARSAAEQVAWLERAAAGGWSVSAFREVLRGDGVLPTRRARSRADVQFVELIREVALLVLRRAQSLGDGWARVPVDVLDRLGNALGESWR